MAKLGPLSTAKTRGHLALNFVGQQTVRAGHCGLNTFAQPGDGDFAVSNGGQHIAQTRQGCGDDDELRVMHPINERLCGVCADCQTLR
jgi:hypothetical protein